MVYGIRLINEATDAAVWIISGSQDKLKEKDYLIDDAFSDFVFECQHGSIDAAMDELDSFCERHCFVLDYTEDKNSALEYDSSNQIWLYEGEPIDILSTKRNRF